MADYAMRMMVAEDLPVVLEIEQHSHRHPWSRALFERELENHLATLLVAEDGGVVVGYLCVWLIAGEAEIHNVATARARQRQGVGSFLMAQLAQLLTTQQIEQVFLEVRVSNLAAIRLYEQCGFSTAARRKVYYHDGEDALVMACSVDDFRAAVSPSSEEQ